MRAAFVPARIKRLHAHRRAVEQFIAQNLHTTTGHTGVLHLRLGGRALRGDPRRHRHRRAGAPGDVEIDRRRTRRRHRAGGKPADGLVAAIGAVGTHLARHFPPDARDVNELPDHLIMLP